MAGACAPATRPGSGQFAQRSAPTESPRRPALECIPAHDGLGRRSIEISGRQTRTACRSLGEGWSRVTFSFDLHDFRGASILKRNPVAHVFGQERFAGRRNPTDGVRFEIEFVNTDDRISFGPAFFIFYRHRCAEGNAV